MQNMKVLDATQVMGEHLERDYDDVDPNMSMETWIRLFRLLPSDLTIMMGVNHGMVVMLKWVLETMLTARTAKPIGRKQKRCQRLRLGLGSRPISKIILNASRHPQLLRARLGLRRDDDDDSEEYNAEADQERLYTSLQGFLSGYSLLETPSKQKGTLLPLLGIHDTAGDCMRAYTIADDLFAVTTEFQLDRTIWDSECIKRGEKRARKYRRKLREEYPDFPTSPKDSPLSSDHEDDYV